MKFLGKDPNVVDAYYTATAEGAITAGKPVIVEADGDVAQISGTTFSTITGTESVFESAQTSYIRTAFDSTANKFVIAYTDGGNSSYGTAVVCTPSSNGTRSYGTPVVFNSGSSNWIACTYDSNADKTLISFNSSSTGKAIVGSVSGSAISFGSAATFESASSEHIDSCFDSTNNKVVIAYQDNADSSKGKAVVATISGTSVSFGSVAQFEAGGTSVISCEHDSTNGKVLIAYCDESNSFYGTAIVGTVSSTSISFGSATVFYSGDMRSVRTDMAFDSNAGKFAVLYAENDSGTDGLVIVATISGTSVSFGSAVEFDGGTITRTRGMAICFNSATNKVNIFYADNADSGKGYLKQGTISGTSVGSLTSRVAFHNIGYVDDMSAAFDTNLNLSLVAYRRQKSSVHGSTENYGVANIMRPVAFSVTNLTSENYIGIAADTYVDNEDSTIGIVGCIDRNQTSLTAGQQYFVQTDGTLATTADDPSVLAGTAISATELVVKE
tara:strand:- start:221 stop:1714 length:1494 start_codon:yes stop_codon:yes gene_type:complete